jgi:hypothetical protein
MVIRTIKSLKEIVGLQSRWEEWEHHPNSDYSIYKIVCSLGQGTLQPYVAVLENDGKPCALLTGRLENTHFEPSIGYFKPINIPARILSVIYRGFLGKIDKENAKCFVDHLWSLLSKKEADAVVIHHLQEHSPLLDVLVNNGPRWWSEKRLVWSKHWSMELPPQQGAFLKKLKSKHRSWIKKKERELESAFPGKVCWHWLKRFDNLPELCSKLEEVAARTYQRGLGAGFVNDDLHRQRFDLFSRRGQLRVQLLEVEGKVKAFWIGMAYKNTFYSSFTGYAPEFRIYEPGTLVFLKMVDELIKEGVRSFDFGLGDAGYKQRFGDRSWREATVRIFAPTCKGLALRISSLVCDALDRLGRKILSKTKLLERFKTTWRRYLRSA